MLKPFVITATLVVAAGAMPAVPTAAAVPARVVAVAAPAGEAVSPDYQVEANGQSVAVYSAKTFHFDGKYSFASFDFSGEVKVRVTSPVSLQRAVILPEGCAIDPHEGADGALEFTLRQPCKLSIERDGENSPLLLFGNALEANPPKPDDPGVVYFGPGVHRVGKITLTSNQTLYVAAGAVVKGGVEARGANIRILGRGIIDGTDYPHNDGPTYFMLFLDRCRDVVVRDVILRGSWLFTVVPAGCDRVLIDNVKICGSRVLNDDGIDPCNSNHVTIQNCFVRTDDDCIAIKGLDGYGNENCENLLVTDCAFWTDRANIVRVGCESDAGAMQDITFRQIDVLHYPADRMEPPNKAQPCILYLQPGNNMPIRRLLFDGVRIRCDGRDTYLIKARAEHHGTFSIPRNEETKLWLPSNSRTYTEDGRCDGCVFRNIVLEGRPGKRGGLIYVGGSDAGHLVENIRFEHVVRFGAAVTASSPDVVIGPFTRAIEFDGEGDPAPKSPAGGG
ncbi:MAG TPA: glycosyl hydrolase family 28 protein [Opitutaceae bacterium]|nr:glycosyl hydrolase family 28 protein [Opitutaceae bacterium]